MPFQSQAQRRFMFSNKPKIAKRWSRYKTLKSLPMYKKRPNYIQGYKRMLKKRLINK